jgi:XRE family transcriptional regulator, master regulator for biofilm formation
MIGKKIHQLRQEKGLSLSELADRAGVAKSYLSAIERDIQGNPSIQVLEKICAVLEVSVPSILDDQPSSKDHATKPSTEPLDPEWISIVREAMQSGISKEEFKEFLEFQKWRAQRSDE